MTPENIFFKYNGENDGVYIENACYDYINNIDDVVIPANKIYIEIEFPLAKTFKFLIKMGKRGFTRKDIIKGVSNIYKYIYAIEAKTTTIPILPHPSYRFKRGATDGIFGIWGHSIEDLLLHSIVYNNKKKCYQAIVSGDFMIS